MGRARTVALAAIALAFACEKASGPESAQVAKPPDPVVVTVSTASLAKAAGGLRAYVDRIRPGGGAAVSDAMIAAALARASGATSLDGLDLAGPLHLIVVDNPTRMALAGKAADRAALDKARGGAHLVVRDGWAVIGPREVVDAVEHWAVPGLVSARPTSAIEASVYLDRLVTRHAAAITEMRQLMATQMAASGADNGMMTGYLDGLVSLAGQTAVLSASLAIDDERAELDIALVPRPASELASFVAAQKPSDFALLGSLPATAPTGMLMAGRLSLGPYRARALAVLTRMMNLGEGARFADTFAGLAALTTGEFAAAFTMSPDGMSMVELVPVSDAGAAEKLVSELAAALSSGVDVESMGIRMHHTGHPEVARHQGAIIHGMTTSVDLDSVPLVQRELFARLYREGQEMHVGFPEGTLVATIGSVELNKQAIDALRDGPPRLSLGAANKRFFDAARARRDSMLFVMDLVATFASFRAMAVPGAPVTPPTAAPGLAMSAGFADHSAHVRFTLYAETVRALVTSVAP